MEFAKLLLFDFLVCTQNGTFNNRLYFFQAFLSYLYLLSFVLHEAFLWDSATIEPVRIFLQVIGIPAWTLPETGFMICFALCGLTLATVIAVGAWIMHGLFTGNMEQNKWQGAFYRFLYTLMTTFWVLFVRMFLAPSACMFASSELFASEGNADLPNTNPALRWKCGKTSQEMILIAVGAALAVLFLTLWLFHSIGHNNDPRSFSALAGPSSEHETHTVILYLGTAAASILMRNSTALWGKLITPVVLFILSAHLFVRMVFLQPYYDSRMNDLKAATFFSSGFTAFFTIAIVILRRCELLPNNGLDEGFLTLPCKQGSLPIIGDSINVILTAIMYALIVVSFIIGYVLSRKRRERLLQRALERLAVEATEKGGPRSYLDIKEKNTPDPKNPLGRLFVPSHSDDKDPGFKNSGVPHIQLTDLWKQIDDYFIAGIGTTLSQDWQAHDIELGARLLLMQNRHAFGNRDPPGYIKDIAEHMFMRGLQGLTQSPYLMLQFVSFCIAYPENQNVALESAKMYLDHIDTKYGAELSLTEEWLSFRRKCDLLAVKRRSQSGNEKDRDAREVEAMGHEEGPKMNRLAREHTIRYIAAVRSLWKHLHIAMERAGAGSKGDNHTKTLKAKLMSLIERAWAAEKNASEAYRQVLARLETSRSGDIITSLEGYAIYLRIVKNDDMRAADITERADSLKARSSSGGSGGSDSATRAAKFEDLLLQESHINVGAVERLKFKLGMITAAIFVIISVLFASYLVLISRYEDALYSLLESGTRRYYTMQTVAGVRSMHVSAVRKNEEEFIGMKDSLSRVLCEFWDVHDSLVRVHQTTSVEQNAFYTEPQLYLQVEIPQHGPGEGTGPVARTIQTSGVDIVYRLFISARICEQSPMYDFVRFRRDDPYSFPALWYILENVHITAKALDEATINYAIEGAEIAKTMRVLFIVLCCIAGLIEIFAVLVIIRPAVESLYTSLDEETETLCKLDLWRLKRMHEDHEKSSKVKARQENTAGKVVKNAKELDSDTSSSDDGDHEDDGIITDEAEGVDATMTDAVKFHQDKEGTADERDRKMQRWLISAFYWVCCAFILGCLIALCLLCVLVVTFAEDSAVEINAGSQRQYVGMRSAYFADELIYSVDRHVSLISGSITWLNSTDMVRCLLRTSAYSLLSTHYAVLYGGTTGWDDLPLSQHWDSGAVGSWLPDGWVEAGNDLPDATQVPGYERPPNWQGDYCTPFTYSSSHFIKAQGTPGSIGRFTSQDNIYFTANCFSKLDDGTELETAFFRNNQRLHRFTQDMLPTECYGFREDIILCAPDGEEEADRRWPLDPSLKLAIETLIETDAVGNCDSALTVGCKEAKSRKRCAENIVTEADIKILSNDQCQSLSKEEAIKKFGAAMSADLNQVLVHDLKHGIGDLNFYATKFEAEPTQGMVKPADTTVRQGLHNFVTFMTDHTISLANERVGDLTEHNKHYLAIHKYADHEYESGKEWTDGLTKSIMACIYEAVTRMHSNTTSTTAGYIVMLVVLALQFFLLSRRIEHLMESNAGMMTLIRRLGYEAGKLKADKDSHVAEHIIDKEVDASSSDNDLPYSDNSASQSDEEYSDKRSQSSSSSSDEGSVSELG